MNFTPPVAACLIVVLVLGALTIGPFMHETDQGLLLDGSAAIVNGQWDVARANFNFDKQYISYLLLAAVFEFLPRPFHADQLVAAGNIWGMIFFWAAFLWLLSRSSRRLPLALALPVILTPAFLVYSPYYASAFVSGAFVILLAGFLDRKAWNWPRRFVVGLLAFCVVGARADGILLLPLLALLHSPCRTLPAVWRSPNTWIMAAAGLVALLVSWRLKTMASSNSFFQFHWDQVLAYLIFGFGGAGVIFALSFHAIWRARRANRCRLWLLFLALGLALPLAFYFPQLLSPRHCALAALGTLAFVCARAGRAILHLYFGRHRLGGALKLILLASALGPVLVGVKLTELRHPQPAFVQPTLFPSPAGASPMGGYLGYDWNVRKLRGFVDQNQAIWVAARDTLFQTNADGGVLLLGTPVECYLHLAVHLQHKKVLRFQLYPGDRELPPSFYTESRSLMRFPFTWPPEIIPAETFFAAAGLEPATATAWHGITILRGQTNLPPAATLSAPLWALNESFGGDEFRIEPLAALSATPSDWLGKKIVLASRDRFVLITAQNVKSAEFSSSVFGHWQICEIGPLHRQPIMVRSGPTVKIYLAVSVFPKWMSLKNL